MTLIKEHMKSWKGSGQKWSPGVLATSAGRGDYIDKE